MKLASRRDGSPDGELLVVSRDLTRAVKADGVAANLRTAVEHWDAMLPELARLSAALDEGGVSSFAFEPEEMMAPLPRAFQWLDASAFRSHGERMVRAFKVSSAALDAPHPVMYQGCSDRFYGAREDFPIPAELDIDLEAEVTVVTRHVPMAATASQVRDSVLLVMLANDVSLRALIAEMNLGFGMIRCKPSTAFSPVAVTPDELGMAWSDGRLHLPVHASINGSKIGKPNAGEMQFSFYELIAHAASTRELCAGSIVGSGTVSNTDDSVGITCLGEQRAKEVLAGGTPVTPFLKFGDRVQIEVRTADGANIFGTIDHAMVPLARPNTL